MVLSAHQPDIFPYYGLFQKMAMSDYFDIASYDYYTFGRYMDRVKIGDLKNLTWLNVPVIRKSSTPINEIVLKPSWKTLVKERILKQYNKSVFKFFKERFYIVERVLDSDHKTLADIGESSIISVKNFFGINAVVDKIGENLPKGDDGIIELVRRYKEKYNVEMDYLSGNGGKAYMDLDYYSSKNVNVMFTPEPKLWLCSVLTPIFMLENPKEILYYE